MALSIRGSLPLLHVLARCVIIFLAWAFFVGGLLCLRFARLCAGLPASEQVTVVAICQQSSGLPMLQ